MSAPLPSELWEQANREHPGDTDARRRAYHDLMVDHGMIVAGEPSDLPCGWPHLEQSPGCDVRLPADDLVGQAAHMTSESARWDGWCTD